MKPIPMMIYSEEKMDRLYRGALRILREAGCLIDHEHLRSLFEKRGLKVDHAKKRVFFEDELVNELLSPCPGRGQNVNFGRFLHPDLALGESLSKFMVGGSFPKYYDWPTKTTLTGNSNTLIEMVHTFGAMPDFDIAGRILTLSDIHQAIEPIIGTALVIKYSPKPGYGEVYSADNIPYLIELGEIITGRKRCTDFIAPWTCLDPPLKLNQAVGDLIIEKAKYGVTSIPTPMPSSGITAPVTREGTIVISLAEVIAVWLCSRIINQDVPLDALFASSTFDMKSATCTFSSPEAILQDCAAAQIVSHYFGVPGNVASNYVDAKMPGIQSTFEKIFKAWWTYQFQGHAVFHAGLLEAGQCFCAAQALLDVEIWKTVNALFTKAPAIDDEIPFDEIFQVICEGGTFLEADSTMKLFRDVLYVPKFLDRSPRGSAEEEAAKADGILDRCQQWYEQVRNTAPEYVAPDDICRAVDKVVDRAKKTLL